MKLLFVNGERVGVMQKVEAVFIRTPVVKNPFKEVKLLVEIRNVDGFKKSVWHCYCEMHGVNPFAAWRPMMVANGYQKVHRWSPRERQRCYLCHHHYFQFQFCGA